MFKILNVDSPFIRFLTKVANLALLNILWTICCIPIITAGASTGAMYTVALQLVRDTDDEVVKPFFRAFKTSFWKATGLFVFWVIAGAFVLTSAFLARRISTLLGIIVLVPLAVFLGTSSYLFPLYAQFENTLFNTIKNAAILSVLNLKRSILTVLWDLLPILLILAYEPLFWKTLVIWPVLGVAVIAYFKLRILVAVFDQYINSSANTELETDE